MTISQNTLASDVFRSDAHYQHLINVVPPWLRQATSQRREALGNSTPGMPASLKSAPAHQHAALGKLISRHVTSQNRVDQMMANLQNPAEFAEPLLKAELKTRFGLELDVRNTCLRLYIPAHIPWLRLKSGAARIWTVSLLDAVLHNFESAETETDAFEPVSTYITPPSANGQFQTLPQVLEKMPITAFTHLSRELDIGQRYKEYLEDNLGISNPVASALLRPKIHDSQKTALTAALQMAQMQKLLGSDVHPLIIGLLDNLPYLRLRGQPWGCHELTIMNARLTGILLFAPDLESARETARVVAYIPDDPEHPIKEYPSSAAFAEDLSRRLRTPDYQQFFSRFINHEDRGHFFAQLNAQLAPITWQPVQSGDARPTWRESPNPRVDLRIASTPINGDLWNHLYQSSLNKILNDARVIAVSTATVDQKARWALWDSFTDIASTLLNIAAFIALPFVPFLGELMLAYMAYQLLDETFESVVDWAEGQGREAFGHLMGVVESAVQLGTLAAGGVIAAGEFRAALPKDIVEFIDRFNSVKRPNGETRYWQPNLSAYEDLAALPADSKPDALGLHRHQDKVLLRLENKCYAVSADPVTGERRIDHPTRAEAYKPALKHNAAGAWQTELDQPLSWDQATLLRRIGPDMQRFSEIERERMLTISGTHENVLRKMHMNVGQVPPLLADTIKRFKIDQDIQTFIEQIGSNQPDIYLKADPVTQLELLNTCGFWPQTRGVRLTDAQGQTLWQSPAPDVPRLQIDVTRLNSGDLLKTMLLALSDEEARAMLSEEFGLPSPGLESRTRSLRQTLVQLAQRKRQSLFEQRYRKLERGALPAVQTLIDAEPGLPTSVAERLMGTANDDELQQLKQARVSPRLTGLSQEANLQVRVTRAYEGLDLTSTENNLDTDRLVLHSLEKLPGWTGQIRLEIRHYTHQGPLIDSIGSVDAKVRKVLVLSEKGSYQAYDASGDELSGLSTLYASLLNALPDAERAELNLAVGEGEKLKRQIIRHALDREELGSLLAQQPNLKPTYDPSLMRLLGGTDGFHRKPFGAPPLQAYAHQLLPQLPPAELQAFVERLQRQPAGPRAELSRLIAEHASVSNTLQRWRSEIPQLIPDTQTRLSEEQLVIQRQARQHFVDQLLGVWREQASQLGQETRPLEFRFTQPIIGELPVLNVGFSRLKSVSLDGHVATRGVHEFLNGFSDLHRLALRNFQLNEMPEIVVKSPGLRQLILSNCAITLNLQSHATLSALDQLVLLDLYKNPLGLMPDVENLPHLNYVDLSETGINAIPNGLLSRPRLRTALLNNNHISELPAALFDLPKTTRDGIDLGSNPLSAAARERIKSHFNLTHQDLGVLAEQPDIHRVQALYPEMNQEQATEFIYQLPGTLIDGRVEISRLEGELTTLINDLAAWTAAVPAVHPVTGDPFNAQQLLAEHSIRDEFKRRVESCWRRQSNQAPLNPEPQARYELDLSLIITGDLPTLRTDFSHVAQLYLHSYSGLSGVGRFLERFPRLNGLTIRNYRLGSIPEATFRMGELNTLELSDCQLTLTPQTVLDLAQMTRLDYLDLSENPLGLTPDLSQMPLLKTLLLNETGITELPRGLFQFTEMETVDLRSNQITHIAADIMEMPRDVAEAINLRGNPLSEESIQRLIAYFQQTSIDFGVEAVIDQAELEVSSSGGSDVDE